MKSINLDQLFSETNNSFSSFGESSKSSSPKGKYPISPTKITFDPDDIIYQTNKVYNLGLNSLKNNNPIF